MVGAVLLAAAGLVVGIVELALAAAADDDVIVLLLPEVHLGPEAPSPSAVAGMSRSVKAGLPLAAVALAVAATTP